MAMEPSDELLRRLGIKKDQEAGQDTASDVSSSPRPEAAEGYELGRQGHIPGSGRPPGAIGRLKYSHEALADFILQNPGAYMKDIATVFGRSRAWVSTIIASDGFQAVLAMRKEVIVDPVLKAGIDERIKGMVFQSLEVLAEKLDKPVVSDQVALRCFELGSKAMGLGGHAPPPPPAGDRLERLAERLIALQSTTIQQPRTLTYEQVEQQPIDVQALPSEADRQDAV